MRKIRKFNSRQLKYAMDLCEFNKNRAKSLTNGLIRRSGFTTLSMLCYYVKYLDIISNCNSYKLVFAFDPKNPERLMNLCNTKEDDVLRIPFISHKINQRTKDLTEAYYLRILFDNKNGKIIDLETGDEYNRKVYKKDDEYYGKDKIIEGKEKFYGNQGLLVSFVFDDILKVISGERKPYVLETKDGSQYSVFGITNSLWMDIVTIEENVILPIYNDFDNMCNIFNIHYDESNND